MKNNMDDVLSSIASRQGVSKEKVIQTLQDVVETVWSQSEGAEQRAELFPEGKPTLGTFLQKMVEETEKEAQEEQLKLLSARDAMLYSLIAKSKLSLTDARLVLQHVRDEAESVQRWLDAIEEDDFDPSEHLGAYEPKERIFRTEALRDCYDVLLLYVGEQDLDAEETLEVLQLVEKELSAMEARQTFTVVSDNDSV